MKMAKTNQKRDTIFNSLMSKGVRCCDQFGHMECSVLAVISMRNDNIKGMGPGGFEWT